MRSEEARCSAHALGIEPPTILDVEDGQLGHFSRPAPSYTQCLATELALLFASLRPDAIVTFGPEGADGHPRPSGIGRSRLRRALAADRYHVPDGPHSKPACRHRGDPRRACLPQESGASDEVEADVAWYEDALRGEVYLRPWFGNGGGDDLFHMR